MNKRSKRLLKLFFFVTFCSSVFFLLIPHDWKNDSASSPSTSERTKTLLRLIELIKLKWLNDQLGATEEHAKALSKVVDDRKNNRRRPLVPAIPTHSDVFCQGSTRRDRACRFRNICLDVKRDKFFILKGPSSLSTNVPSIIRHDFLELTSLDDHNLFFWSFDEAPGDFFLKRMSNIVLRTVDVSLPKPLRINDRRLGLDDGGPVTNLTIVKGSTYLTKRFFPLNIMHVFHDDWLGLYSLRDYWPSLMDDEDGSPSIGLVTFDHHPPLKYDEIYEWLGNHYSLENLIGWPHWVEEAEKRPSAYICFEDAIVGNHKGMSWYQYGYGKPQGPIAGHTATGFRLREAAQFVFKRLALPTWNQAKIYDAIGQILNAEKVTEMKKAKSDPCIAVFSRKSNRLILNEPELDGALQVAFGLPICWIRLEDQPIPKLVARLRNAVAAFGMHGSILILAMFMPPGSVLIEGFPHGVPPEQYTPYRTLTNLPGQQMAYRAWSPSDPAASIGHPDRSPYEGGIRHLSEAEQQFILTSTTIPPHPCCDNPHWLYRIFQDTFVDPSAIIALIREALGEAVERRKH